MRSKNKNRVIVILVVALIATYGYWIFFPSSRPWEPSTEKVPVRFAYQFGFHYGQHIIMDHFDLVEKYSAIPVDVTYTKIAGGATIYEGIIAGSIEFGSMSLPAAVAGIDKGVDAKILASMGAKEHKLWTWRDDIHSIADLQAGDKISVVAPESIGEISLIKEFLELGKTKDDALAVCMYFKHPDSFQLMESREIDGHYVGEPYSSQYVASGDYHAISSDSEIWGEMPGSTLIGKVSFYEDNPEIVAAVFSAWCEATQWIIDNPKEASHIIGDIFGYDEDEAWTLWQAANLMWNPTYGLSAIEDYAQMVYELGIASENLTKSELVFPITRGVAGI